MPSALQAAATAAAAASAAAAAAAAGGDPSNFPTAKEQKNRLHPQLALALTEQQTNWILLHFGCLRDAEDRVDPKAEAMLEMKLL